MVRVPQYPYRMADVELIKDLAINLIMALDKHSSPNDIVRDRHCRGRSPDTVHSRR